jgi:hypothetical protein
MPCGCALAAFISVIRLLDSGVGTATFEMEKWDVQNGFQEVQHYQLSGTMGASRSGSRFHQIHAVVFRHYFLPDLDNTEHSILRKSDDLYYVVDHSTKVAEQFRCACSWQEPDPPPYDEACRSAAELLHPTAESLGFGKIAGFGVVRYKAFSESQYDEFALAPQLGCEVLEHRATTYNTWGFPTSHLYFVVRSYLPGDPPAELFQPPEGYAVRLKGRR